MKVKEPPIKTKQTLVREEYERHYRLIMTIGVNDYLRQGMMEGIFFDQVRRKINRLIARCKKILKENEQANR